MTFEVWADPGFDQELRKFSKKELAQIEAGLLAYAEAPVRHPKATRLAGSTVILSFRLRIGPFRVIGTLFTSQEAMLVTTVFRMKRNEDYKAAMMRHEKRLLAQVPPISQYLQDLGF